ncbi:transcription factor TFIIIB component B'' homolog [Ixodes scapularis]|uniref:transcription factor TFIIIB component B'' homolog n=1 Tax=Ixodes scapularis TaxID=6945 RepID=UPI001C380ED0|nr:transcription factor TFIIIB component B'' homolog [Ixodes scapularis]
MSTRRSRIQIKPNTGRKGDNAAAKPAAPLKPQGVRKSSGISVPAPALPVEEPAPNPAEETPCCVGADNETPHVEAAVAEVGVPSQPESTIEKPPPSPPPPAAQPAEPASLPPVEEIGPPEPAAQVVQPPAPPPLPLQRTRASKRPAENEPKNARPAKASNGTADAPAPKHVHSQPTDAAGENSSEPSTEPPSESHTDKKSEARSEPKSRKANKKPRRTTRTASRKPPADRSAMTMMDLIYYNPPGNPMPEKTSKVRILEDSAETVDDPAEPEAASDEDGSEASAGPRVRVGPNGEITLDEESLVVRRQAPRSEPRPVVYETGHETNYTSFRRQPHGRRTWTEKQTARFYRALSVCGTDFTLMATFFPERTRQDLKNKFKREERMHRDLVDKAINDPTQFDLVGLEEEMEDPDDPEPTPDRQTKRRGRKRKAVAEEQVEEEVVHEEIIIEDATAENTTAEKTGIATPSSSGTPGAQAPLELQSGQLVFYASRAQEQVVHVFVVSPQGENGSESSSELVNRLSSPPLRSPPPATAEVSSS